MMSTKAVEHIAGFWSFNSIMIKTPCQLLIYLERSSASSFSPWWSARTTLALAVAVPARFLLFSVVWGRSGSGGCSSLGGCPDTVVWGTVSVGKGNVWLNFCASSWNIVCQPLVPSLSQDRALCTSESLHAPRKYSHAQGSTPSACSVPRQIFDSSFQSS